MFNCHKDDEELEPDIRPLRRQYPRYSFESPAAGAKAPWTSARCHRLLRPLFSKIALLRKGRQTSSGHNEANHGGCQSGTTTSGIVAQQHTHLDSTVTVDGGGWECSPRPRKRIRRTYSSKLRRQETIERGDEDKDTAQISYPSRDAVIGLPPCFSEQAVPIQGASSASSSKALQDGRRRIYKGVSRTSSGNLVHGICNGLEALLQASATTTHPAPGCRSLFSTCLRQVPRYISEEETFSSIDDPDNDLDISSEVYNDLEGIGPMPDGGWKPLREVVRAHGLDLIVTAVEEGLLGTTVALHIVGLCLRLRAYDEAQRVLECMTFPLTAPQKLTSNDATPSFDGAKAAFANINNFAVRTRRYGFLYWQIAAMLDSGVLPLEWVANKAMIECWNGVIRSIAQGDDHTEAATTLLRTTISKSYQYSSPRSPLNVHDTRLLARKTSRRPKLRSAIATQDVEVDSSGLVTANTANSTSLVRDSGSHSAISNVLTVLSAISLLSTSEPALASHNSNTVSTTILQILALDARQRLELASCSITSCGDDGLFYEPIRLPLLAAGLSSLAPRRYLGQLSLGDSGELRSLSTLSLSNEFATEAGSFLCTIARCCAQARSRDAFEAIQPLVKDLLIAAKSRNEDKATITLCGSIALAAAFAFSEDTSQPDHLDWALGVELALNSEVISPNKPAIEKTPARGITQSKNGYRWEEGICEWIARTPAVALRIPSDSGADAKDKDKTAERSSSSPKQDLALLSEWSPSSMHQRPSRDTGRPACGEVVALYVRVNSKAGDCGDVCASEELRLKEIYERPQKKTSPLRPFQDIYMDDDIDELSTPESSQEKPSALTTLREIRNMACGAKRKRHLYRNGIAPKSSRMVKSQLANERQLDIDILDTEDELSAL